MPILVELLDFWISLVFVLYEPGPSVDDYAAVVALGRRVEPKA